MNLVTPNCWLVDHCLLVGPPEGPTLTAWDLLESRGRPSTFHLDVLLIGLCKIKKKKELVIN